MISQMKRFISGVFCINLLIFKISITHSSSNVTLEQTEVEISLCEDWQFQCENEQCIPKPFICDGYRDCEDASDETYDQCRKSSTRCDARHFKCNYGACIEKKYTCDGKKECIDGSDEYGCAYGYAAPSPQGVKCAVPGPTADKTVDFICFQDPSKACYPSRGFIPEYTIAIITCASNHYRENKNQTSAHSCFTFNWSPPLTKCLKRCDKLNPVNVNMKCYRDRIRLDDCGENSFLLAGTKVRAMCKTAYKYDSPPSYFEITCDEDGKWDNILLPCVPECGKPYTSAKTIVFGGKPENNGGSPWHAAIFNKEKELICGGTIITENLVLSAAHCFTEGNTCEGTECVKDFEIAVGKYTNNYTAKDNPYQRTIKIKEIHFPEQGYHGSQNYHASDLAILILNESIPISPAVLPACINWVDLINRKYPLDGESGKVVGWGRTENNTLSTILRTIHLPFISYKRCIDVVDDDFKAFITLDKICAGTGNRTGPTLLDGDSGGGLLFEDRGLFYLRGVVSVKQYSSNAATIFTDLANYVEWIQLMRDKFKSKSQQNQKKLNNTFDTEIISQDITSPVHGEKQHNLEKINQENVKQPNKSFDQHRISQDITLSVHENKSKNSEKIEQEYDKRPLLDEIINYIKSYRFFVAEKWLLKMDPNIYNYLLYKVYNNSIDNFDLLLDFGKSISNIEKKFKTYEFLCNETLSSGFKNARKLVRFSEAVQKEIIDRSPEFLPSAKELHQRLFNATIKSAVEVFSSAFQNDSLWSAVQELTVDIYEWCRNCMWSILNSTVEIVWNKITLDELLLRMRNFKYLTDTMFAHIIVTEKLERTAALDKKSAKKLLIYMKFVMHKSFYKDMAWDIQSKYEELKEKLLQYATIKTCGSDIVAKEKQQKLKPELLTEAANDIKGNNFLAAEEKLFQIGPNAYLNLANLVFTNNETNKFDLLLDFSGYIRNIENKFKIYDFLYNKIAPGSLDYLQKLLRLCKSVQKEILDQSAAVLRQAQELHQSLKNAIVKTSIAPISSAFQNDDSWSTVNVLGSNISSNCFDCSVEIYKSVVKALLDKVTIDGLLKKAQKNLPLTEVIAFHLAVIDKLKSSGALYTMSAVTLARDMKSTMQASEYEEVDSHKRFQHNDAKNKLPLSVKNLVFSSAICIKNTWFDEYLYADVPSHDIYKGDKDKQPLYTRIPKDHNELVKFKWYATFWSSHQIQLRDDRFNGYLYVDSKTNNDSWRYALTWNTNAPNENVVWDLEVDGNYIRIKDNFYQEYLFANYDINENQTRRNVFTYHREGRTLDDKWQIDDCS